MSLFPVSLTPTAAYSASSVHPHSHKKGGAIESQNDASAQSGTQAAVGSTQNLFSRLFKSLEQTVGSLPAAVAKIALKI